MTVGLQDIELQAYHGVLESERRQGNRFRVSVSLTMPDSEGIQTDCIQDTCDYSQIYRIVEQQMAVPSDLLEHVAGRIVDALHVTYSEVSHISVSVSKHNPPVGGNVEWATIGIERDYW